MYKKYLFFAGTLAVIIGITAFAPSATKANPSDLGITSLAFSQGFSNPLAIASSSATYLVSGNATTTYVTTMDRQDQFDLNLYAVASSTSSTILFAIDYSDDYGCYSAPASCNWYREDRNTVSGSVVTHDAATYHTWTPASTATSTKNVTFASVGARFMRVSLQAQAANITVWAQTAVKGQHN